MKTQIVITGQLRKSEWLVAAVDRHNAEYPDLDLQWTVSTWSSELDDNPTLRSDLQDRSVRLVVSPSPQPWGIDSGLPQHLALAHSLYGLPSEAITIRTRSDTLVERGVGEFLQYLLNHGGQLDKDLVVESAVINSLFFAADPQFMARARVLGQISDLDATHMSRVRFKHVEQQYFAPARYTCRASDYWHLLDVGTMYDMEVENSLWAKFRTDSPLFSAALAEYYRHIEEHWDTVQGPVELTETGRYTLEELLFAKTDTDINFTTWSYLAYTSNFAWVSHSGIASLKPSEFGDRVLQYWEAPPDEETLVSWTGSELQRMRSIPYLGHIRTDVNEVSSDNLRFAELPEYARQSSLEARLRILEAENSHLRSSLSEFRN